LPKNKLTVSKKAVPVASECPSTSTSPSIAKRPLSSSASEVSPGLKAGIRPGKTVKNGYSNGYTIERYLIGRYMHDLYGEHIVGVTTAMCCLMLSCSSHASTACSEHNPLARQ
jgi:hypothetical protein